MAWFDWILEGFWSTMNWIFEGIDSSKVMILGLENSGKTSLISVLKNPENGCPEEWNSTNGWVHEDPLPHFPGSVKPRTVDVGGSEEYRKMWVEFCQESQGIIFIIDCVDDDRLPLAKAEIERLAKDEAISQIPLLILINKVDLLDKRQGDTRKQVLDKFGWILFDLKGLRVPRKEESEENGEEEEEEKPIPNRPIAVYTCSIKNGTGFMDGLQWLAQHF